MADLDVNYVSVYGGFIPVPSAASQTAASLSPAVNSSHGEHTDFHVQCGLLQTGPYARTHSHFKRQTLPQSAVELPPQHEHTRAHTRFKQPASLKVLPANTRVRTRHTKTTTPSSNGHTEFLSLCDSDCFPCSPALSTCGDISWWNRKASSSLHLQDLGPRFGPCIRVFDWPCLHRQRQGGD